MDGIVHQFSEDEDSKSPIPSIPTQPGGDLPNDVPAAPATDFLESPSASPTEENPFDFFVPPVNPRLKQVWAIGGGKGGVGKSLVASSLAVSLSRLGNKVIAIDLDLGGANLHTTLGVDLPRQTLSDFFQRKATIESCVVPSGIPNLDLISGAHDAVAITEMRGTQMIQFLEKMKMLDADYLVLDLGAGTSLNTLDFFLFADVGIITLLPEPTSIENAYRFIKSAYFRRLKHSKHLRDVRPLIDAAMDPKNALGIRSPSDLFREVNKQSPETAMKLKREIESFRLKLIVNQARTQTDVDIGFSVKTVCKKYFGINMDYVGFLDYDSSVWQAVRRKRPFMLEFPNSRLVSSVERIVQYVTKRCYQERNQLF
jgi:flagellar biosynthesis protein FlhG